MNCNLPKITYPTLRILLLLKIHEAISLWGDVPVLNDAIGHTPRPLEARYFKHFAPKAVLKQVFTNTSYAAYDTSIGLQLSAALQQPVPDILRHLAEVFRQTTTAEQDAEAASFFRVFSDLTVTFADNGSGRFEFGDGAIAAWLKFLIDTKINIREGMGSREQAVEQEVWFGQVMHARCGALLRLGAQILARGEISWLTEEGRLRISGAAERNLLFQIIAVMDALEDRVESRRRVLKLLQGLSCALERCDREWQILGEIRGTDGRVTQCRLGLVMITKWLSAHLLEDKLGVYAPLEL